MYHILETTEDTNYVYIDQVYKDTPIKIPKTMLKGINYSSFIEEFKLYYSLKNKKRIKMLL